MEELKNSDDILFIRCRREDAERVRQLARERYCSLAGIVMQAVSRLQTEQEAAK